VSGPQGSGGNSALTLGGLVVAGLGLGALWVAVRAGTPAAGDGPVPTNPIALVLELLSGRRTWPGGRSNLVATGFGVLLLLAFVLGLLVVFSRMSGGSRIDRKARLLAPPGRLVGITPKEVARSAAVLRPGVDLRDPASHGVALGVTVRGKTPLRMDWEGVGLVLAGPRVGKSTSFAVPAIVDAPGVCVVTSNKADLTTPPRVSGSRSAPRGCSTPSGWPPPLAATSGGSTSSPPSPRRARPARWPSTSLPPPPVGPSRPPGTPTSPPRRSTPSRGTSSRPPSRR
jgi:hypothetical protein